MTSTKTHISWTHSTWNPTTGCTAISAGCDHCYARVLTERLGLGGGDFSIVRTHENRLIEIRKFKPIEKDGELLPHLVFVNSMSDLFHDDIPDAFRDKVFDAMENVPTASAVFQILTKRHMTMRRYIERRYHGIPIPRHIWLGVSCEDNRVRGRLDALRRMKDAMGDFTAFVSVEPLIGAVDKHDYSGLDWILIGGESGPECRDCWPEWAFTSIDLARKAKAAVWGKQWGHWRNNPLYRTAAQALGEKAKHVDKVRHAIDHGEKEAAVEMVSGKVMVTGEKGGATFRGDVLHELPPWYANLKAILSAETQGKQAAKVGGMFAQALR